MQSKNITPNITLSGDFETNRNSAFVNVVSKINPAKLQDDLFDMLYATVQTASFVQMNPTDRAEVVYSYRQMSLLIAAAEFKHKK